MIERTARGAKTLPGEYYTSESIYEEETERIFTKRWLYVGRASDVSEPGHYFLHNMDKESIILLKDEQHSIRAFFNVCRHRGTRLCTEARGRFSQSIQCPYHAWTYSLDGRLIGAPNMHEVKTFNKEEYPLRDVAVATWEGGVFMNLAESPEPFENAFAPIVNKYKQWHLSELQVAHRRTYDVAANWKLILQNYSECYHCPTLHPHLNRLTPYRDSSNDLEAGPFLGGPMRLSGNNESMTMTGRSCAPTLGEVSGTDLKQVYYYVIFPNMLLSLHPDYVLVHQVQRQAPDRCRVVCDWLFHPEAISHPDFDPGDAIEFWELTNKQDWHVCELSQQGVASRAYTPGPYSDLESMIAAFDREYLSALGMSG
ncbi:aromatic ring-hydroxylating dioxygenase subunit alpha [candidate division KSB1 bacterium]|nr:aromatic ring-hydroxylating dioxygenase subunit alpha [candidate division KSB1 bacterium]NIR71426.1 aromatic ring-hydroxylating dioxygenase subunit alpha [candidate division KSB1 bacterium]NIS23347.1 aromatic ring-hydroxylating dioxygenase subunit alpha [candidate division KSB1 bacterium]NIT70238.1 aromatic ring-hydroxylating dioxygenase subunit alpha [candidate division KSB1 bacterium]NIU23961.1 aromatic ring-hydroxylating dioxygenase subunit alpha [candidate division KSB1 bacterium]